LIVERRESETAERLLKRFQLVIQRAGVLGEAKRRRHFVSTGEKRRIAQAKSARRARKNAEKALLGSGDHVRPRT
jgi:ribosomal protein S21